MWALLEDGSAVNVNKLDAVWLTRNDGFRLACILGPNRYFLKGVWNTEGEARAALMALTGAVDAAN